MSSLCIESSSSSSSSRENPPFGCTLREPPVGEVLVMQCTGGVGTWTSYLVYLYTRWLTRSLLCLSEPLKLFFFVEGTQRTTTVCLLCFNLRPSQTHLLSPPVTTVCLCLCQLRLTLCCSTPAMWTKAPLDFSVI